MSIPPSQTANGVQHLFAFVNAQKRDEHAHIRTYADISFKKGKNEKFRMWKANKAHFPEE
jgi:hypothetical protein